MAIPPTPRRQSPSRHAEDGHLERKLVRIPVHVMKVVKAMAKRDRRSVNAEVVYALECLIRNDKSREVMSTK